MADTEHSEEEEAPAVGDDGMEEKRKAFDTKIKVSNFSCI
jgi:hypothetical protein